MKKEQKQDVERIEVETIDVPTIDVERAEVERAEVQIEPFEEEPKLGLGKRIKKRMHEFGERHPKAVSVCKAVGVFSVAFLSGFAVATVNERRKWAKDVVTDSIGENCVSFPEESGDIINVEVDTVNNVPEEIPDIDISSEG